MASTYSGYSGSGYVTALTSEWSKISFDKGVDANTSARLDIRYTNATGASVTNLALYIGSSKVQSLVFPVTSSWTTWNTLSVNFTLPAGYQNIQIKSEANASSSVNIDYSDLTVGVVSPPASFSQSAPASGATAVAVTPAFSWGAATDATSYALVVSTSSSFSSPVINVTGLTSTSYTPTTPLANSTVYYWKVTASNSAGNTIASNSGISFTTTAPLPAPGSFTQTSPASGATGIVAMPAFTWAASSNASTYNIVVATNSAFTSPVINATALISNNYTPTVALAASTLYYWKVTAVNATGSTVATNAGISFTTAAPPPVPGSFSQIAPASGATSVSVNPSFSWGTAINASTYSVTVATNSSYTSPVVNATGITTTSYTPSVTLSNGTLYYWKVTAVNSTGSTVASNSGIGFTTVATSSQQGLTRQIWTGIPGTAVGALTSNSNYPNNPTSTSIITSFQTSEYGDNYGQRIYGYLAPTVSGSYNFWIAADDDAELWLSTNDQPANKVKIASVTGWTNPLQYDKYSSQASTAITLTAGSYYYVEVLHKENDGGDHISVAWQVPDGSQVIIPGSNLLTATPIPIPLPGVFNQTAPASAATNVSVTPAFTWQAASDAASYSLVVSTSNTYANPVINISNITGTSYTPSVALAGGTLYYWKVTATNVTGNKVATNAGISFNTLVPPPPAAFTQTTPAGGASGVSRTPAFSWAASSGASSYSLVVSTSNTYANPVINVSNITATSYNTASSLVGSTTYYWKVTAINSSGSNIATNAGLSFTTGATTGTTFYVATTGVDAVGRGSSSAPFKTLSYAATQVPANQNNTIYLNAGTYYETAATILPTGVNIEGAGEAVTTITSSGAIPAPGVDQTSGDWKLWYDGTLIQLVSASYNNDISLKYGSPAEMTPAANGSQSLSGFTIDGNNKQIKAGVWVQNRNNVTMHHVSFKNLQMRGAVFGRSDMWWYTPLPDGKWMKNTTIYNCTFTNSGADIGGESLGNLCLAGLDTADIYNITINENQGYGIKFIFVGHYRNMKIHDCTITVPESDPSWGEDISMELWNFSYNNEVYNINCNTWFSFVNDVHFNDYQPTAAHPSNLKVHDIKMIDQDGSSSKESIECALSGVEIYNSYIQDKGFGVAIWGGSGWSGGTIAIHDVNIHNNIFANVNRTPGFGFGNSAGVFNPDPANNIKVNNNVFDRMGNGIQLNATTVEIRNNAFLNTEGDDVQGGSGVTFTNNLKYHTNPTKANFSGNVTGANNILGNPGYQNTGSRWDTYYKPSSASSFAVDKGYNLGLPYNGSAPDIGRWEYGGVGGQSILVTATSIVAEETKKQVVVYPNPTTQMVRVSTGFGQQIRRVDVLDNNGRLVMIKSNNEQKATMELSLGNLSAGVYYIRIVGSNGTTVKKVLLQK